MVSRKAVRAKKPLESKRISPRKSSATAAFALRPVARVQKISLFEREVRERLSRAAVDLLFAQAEVISEGQPSVRGGKQAFFGSTMFTMNLERLLPSVRDACDAGTAKRLVTLLETDAACSARIKAVVAHETTRVAGTRPRSVNTEMKVHSQGACVYIDVDVEAILP